MCTQLSLDLAASRSRSLALITAVLSAACLCSASNITYNVNQTIGSGGVTGNIITDGKTGVLGQADIVFGAE